MIKIIICLFTIVLLPYSVLANPCDVSFKAFISNTAETTIWAPYEDNISYDLGLNIPPGITKHDPEKARSKEEIYQEILLGILRPVASVLLIIVFLLVLRFLFNKIKPSGNNKTVSTNRENDYNDPNLETLMNEIIHYVDCCNEFYQKWGEGCGMFYSPKIAAIYDPNTRKYTNSIQVYAILDREDLDRFSNYKQDFTEAFKCVSEFSIVNGDYWNVSTDYHCRAVTKNKLYRDYSTLDKVLVQRLKLKYPDAKIRETPSTHKLYISVDFKK